MCFSDLGLWTPHSASNNLSLYALDWKPHFKKQTFHPVKWLSDSMGNNCQKSYSIFKTHQYTEIFFAFTELSECIADREI